MICRGDDPLNHQTQSKTMKTTSIIIITVSLGFLGAASAKPEGRAKGSPDGHKLPAALIARFDKDGDGKLSQQEREAAKAARKNTRAKILERFDTDKDGKLSEAEREVMRAEILAKFDKDGDGALSKEEREAAQEEFPRPGGPGARGGSKRERGDKEAPSAGE